MSTPNTPRRRLILIDIENLAGGPTLPDLDKVKFLWRGTCLLRPHTDDLAIIGCNPALVFAVQHQCEFRHRVVARRGASGADLALIDAWHPRHISHRFDQVVIGSGDRMFAVFAAACAGLGLTVTVIARHEALSKRLRLAADQVLTIPMADHRAAA